MEHDQIKSCTGQAKKLCVVACDLNKLYLGFWTVVKKTWTQLVGFDCKLILIADEIPSQYVGDPDIILWKPIEGMHTAFQAQCIRILYPAIIQNGDNGVIISDIDMIPMSRKYFLDSIKNIDEDCFISYKKNDKYPEINICYCLAKPSTWREIFNIYSEEDIRVTLSEWYSNTNYNGVHGMLGGIDWCTDQIQLYKYVNKWEHKETRYIRLDDKDTGYNRLCRSNPDIMVMNEEKIKRIRDGYYSDFHMLRPYSSHQKLIDFIVNLLS